ncbi:MAG: hypothetical protein M1837_005116 [Sclerophora amabilis]|nr:MAG: hypothetical protein M1837_005116 [Sclerophora amabilis]
MHPAQIDTDDDAVSHKPVKVYTKEDAIAWRKTMLAIARTDPDAWVSPFGDESVQGYKTDKQPIMDGIQDIKTVVKILEDAGVSCCMVAEPALIYYGTNRLKMEWIMCVPTEFVEKAADLFRAQPDAFELFRPSALSRSEGMEHLYPRFKFVGMALFFTLMSSQACHLPCDPNNIEYSHNGIPYPKLPAYAQSLLDTWNIVDLDDLVDGMNLSLKWGEENLDLEGTIDAEWGRWRADALHGGKAEAGFIPRWCSNPKKKRDIWAETVSAEAKKNRQGWKYSAKYETRFSKFGRQDPRLTKRDFC